MSKKAVNATLHAAVFQLSKAAEVFYRGDEVDECR